MTHEEVVLEQGKVGSSTGCDRALCLQRRKLGTDHPASSSPLALNSHNLGTGTIRAKGHSQMKNLSFSYNEMVFYF